MYCLPADNGIYTNSAMNGKIHLKNVGNGGFFHPYSLF